MSVQPLAARWYITDVPVIPPPHTTTLARFGRGESDVLLNAGIWKLWADVENKQHPK